MPIARDILDQVAILMRPLQVRIANSIARAVVQLVDDGRKLQLLQLGVLAKEDVEDAERFGEYGFFSIPLPGAEAVVVFPGGDRGHPLVVSVDDRRYRPTGGEGGEAGLYTDEGDEVRLKRGNVIVIKAGTSVQLGGPAATNGVIKGNQRHTAEAAFLDALTTFIGKILVPTGVLLVADKTALTTAITTFKAAAAAAISTKVKTE